MGYEVHNNPTALLFLTLKLNKIMETIEIVITKEHYVENSRYTDVRNCPLAIVMKKLLNKDVIVGTQYIKDNGYIILGSIQPRFGWREYYDLKSGKTTEFRTTFTPVE